MSIISHVSAALCVSCASVAEPTLGVMTDSVPVGGELSEQRWITLTDSDCALSCDASPPEALPFVFFKLFSGEPNEKSGFYPETRQQTFSCA